MAVTPLHLQFFGAFDLQVQGEKVGAVPKPGQELLCQLAIAGLKGADRTDLANGLWPDVESERAQFYLRRCLTQLRTAFGPERARLEALDERRIVLNLSDCACDVTLFDGSVRIREAKDLESAALAYAGDLLPGHRSEWVRHTRLAYRERYLAVLSRLSTEAEEAGDLESAQRWLVQATRIDPIREETCRQLMRLLRRKGNFAGIAQAFRDLRMGLRQGLGLPPGQETVELYRELLADARVVAGTHSEPQTTPVMPMVELPVATTPFVGREDEQADLAAKVTEHRQITVIGLGGVGKSRLVNEVACAISGKYELGIAYADLSACAGEADVTERISQSLGVSDSEDLLKRLARVSGRILLVLDGAEHVAAQCGNVLEGLFQNASELHVLCSSQVPLQNSDEHIVVLNPLGLPDQDASCEQEVGASDAVSFFVACATRAVPSFRLGADNLTQVVELCRRLDGLPLALELAAVRLRTLPLSEIVANLDDRFRLLDRASVGRGRPRTLRGVLDWSFKLLSPDEERLFIRLGVFPASWTVAAVQAICSDEALAPRRILGSLGSLVDHSLVVYDPSLARYRMLETVRSYSRGRLGEDEPMSERLQIRHADYYLKAAGEVSQQGFDRAGFLSEDPNFSSAVDHFLASEDSERKTLALKVVNRLFPRWYESATVSSGIQTTLKILESFEGVQNEAVAESLFRAAGAAHWLYQIGLATKLFVRAEAMADTLGLEVWSMESLLGRGEIAANEGRLEEAERILTAALARFEAADDPLGEARCLGMLGYVKREKSEFDAARTFTESALAINVVTDNMEQRLWCMGSLAAINLADHSPERAEPILLETLAHQERVGNKPAQAWNLTMLGVTQVQLGKYEDAENCFNRVLNVTGQDVEDLHRAWPNIEIGELHRRTGRLDEARIALLNGLKLSRASGSLTLEARALLRLSMVERDSLDMVAFRAYRAAVVNVLSKIQAPQLLAELAEIDAEIASSIA